MQIRNKFKSFVYQSHLDETRCKVEGGGAIECTFKYSSWHIPLDASWDTSRGTRNAHSRINLFMINDVTFSLRSGSIL